MHNITYNYRGTFRSDNMFYLSDLLRCKLHSVNDDVGEKQFHWILGWMLEIQMTSKQAIF